MKKIAFFGIAGHSRYTCINSLPYCDSMPRSAGSDMASALELYGDTDNKGNMIHGEAPTRFFQMDREKSCYVSTKSLILKSDWTPEEIAKELSQKFDLVVFSTANMIRSSYDPGSVAAILDALTVNFVVLGMGMQNPLAASTESLHPRLNELLDVCNRKATVFGVRGLETQKWLHSVGFNHAKALGCPSLYVYPKNILSISAPDPKNLKSALTGGYISAKTQRSTALIKLFKGFNAHYVMQDELARLKKSGLLSNNEYLYNDASGEVNKNLINSVLERIHYKSLPFSSYRWFQDPNAWRVFAAQFDFYLGDRLHGGVAALQSGVPAIMIAEDRRVKEITEFFNIPQLTISDIDGMNIKDNKCRYFCESLFWASQPNQAAKITRQLMPPAAPIRPRHLVTTQQGVVILAPSDFTVFRDALQVFYVSLRKPARRYTYRGLKIFTSLALRFQDFQRL